MPRTTLFRYPDGNISHWKTSAMLAAYLIYTAWMTAYAAIRRPATTNARYIDYFALAFFGITLLLFGWLFIVQGITPFVQGNADSGRSYQYWHLWFLAFPYLYIGHIVLLVFNTIRLLLPPYPPRFVHYAALLLALLSGWHVSAFMPTA
ncbi:hypothetical protein [Kingella denitrificans]|nr:hypothetical protein [Kingella denitrificans]